MKIIKCDVCGKGTGDNSMSISASGMPGIEGEKLFEYLRADVCPSCYMKFKKEFTKILSPFVNKTKKVAKK